MGGGRRGGAGGGHLLFLNSLYTRIFLQILFILPILLVSCFTPTSEVCPVYTVVCRGLQFSEIQHEHLSFEAAGSFEAAKMFTSVCFSLDD